MKIIITLKTSCLLFLLTISNMPCLQAQDRNLSSRFLTGKDGLPQGYVSGIVQDKTGFIWIGTRNGLARYDGKKFKVFYHNANDTTSIAGNLINNIFLDSRNRLWIKYDGAGLDIFYVETEKIYHINNQKNLEFLKSSEVEVDGMYEDMDGGLLLNTFHTGLIKLTMHGKVIVEYPLKNILERDKKIFGITQDKNHHLFILTKNFLYHLNERQVPISKIPFSVPSSVTESLQGRYGMFFSSDSILFVSGVNGIAKYRLQHNIFSLISVVPSVKKMRGNNIYSLAYLNKQEGTFTFSSSPVSYTFLTNADADITSLLDRSGMLWIGTSGYGIQLVYLKHHSFQYYKYKPPFTAFLFEKYLGVRHNDIPENLSAADNIYNLRWAYDKTGTLWMSNRKDGNNDAMQVYGYNNGHFISPNWHALNGEKINQNTVYGIASDSKNSLWVLREGYDLNKLNTATGTIETFAPKVPFTMPGADLSLLIDKQDNFWIASNFGLLHWRAGQQNYTLYSLNKNMFNQEANRVINIAEDLNDDNKLWMGSFGNGLISFNKKEKKFTSYTKKDGLPDNTIYSVMADDNGFLWCSTNQGIFRFDTRTNKARKYTAENGAPDFEFNRFHHVRLPDGRFAFGGFEDYTVFDPLALADDTLQPNTAIVSWQINNKPADYGDEGSPLSQSINSLREVHLNYLQNFLTFEYAALQYDQPGIFEYRYKLSGIDKDWVYASTRTSINYTDLSPGTYNLSINAGNASGLWSNKIKELRIIIDPPWWKTWWFYTAVVIAALSLMYVVYRYRLNQLLKIERVRNHIARDLHDEIGSSLSTISIYAKVLQQQLKNKGEDTRHLIEKISDNTNHVQDAMNDIVWSINTRNDELENIINRMREHAIQLFEAKDYALHFNFDDSLNAVKLNMEQRKDFYLIYKEALNNIAKYAEGENVWISLTQTNSNINLAIKDDGKGFDTKDQNKNGNGLHNMQTRAQALKGALKIISENGNGTTIELTIPK